MDSNGELGFHAEIMLKKVKFLTFHLLTRCKAVGAAAEMAVLDR